MNRFTELSEEIIDICNQLKGLGFFEDKDIVDLDYENKINANCKEFINNCNYESIKYFEELLSHNAFRNTLFRKVRAIKDFFELQLNNLPNISNDDRLRFEEFIKTINFFLQTNFSTTGFIRNVSSLSFSYGIALETMKRTCARIIWPKINEINDIITNINTVNTLNMKILDLIELMKESYLLNLFSK